MFDFIIKYWVQWICGLISAGVIAWAKRYVKLQRESWLAQQQKREEELKHGLMIQFQEDLKEEIRKSDAADQRMNAEIQTLSELLENLNTGLLSVQGRQFRENCLRLLATDHIITVLEYEEFEEEYTAYKALGGNHRGDALHDRVVEKFNASLIK